MTGKSSGFEIEEEVSEFVDPAPVAIARLSRRNILALALSLAGVLLVLFFSSRRQSAESITEYDLPPASTPDILTLAPVEPRAPQPNPWEPPKAVYSEHTDERKMRFEQARQSRGVIRVSGLVTPDSMQNTTVTPKEKSELILLEGSVIETALETGIHTGRPGPVRARITRPVRDSKRFQAILIPAGTQLIGSMEGTLAGEEPRALIVWNRMIFPNGEARDLPGLPAIDLDGEAGLQDKVKYHRAQRFGSAAMMALVGSATSIATAGTASGLVGNSLALELSRTATSQFERGRQRQPTLILQPGYQFLVYVSRDMSFTESYTE